MKVGFIGLGAMGRGIAANIRKADYPLVVHDLNAESADAVIKAGAVWASSPAEVAKSADVVFTSLPMPADVEAVAYGDKGLLSGLRKGAAWIDVSTNSLEVVKRLDAATTERGGHFMDAPLGGVPTNAAAGTLTIWVGGEQAQYEKHKPLLEAISDRTVYMGSAGAATITKLAQNMASCAINSVILEILTMGVKAGVELLPLWEGLRSGKLGQSRPFDNIAPRLLPGKFDPPSFQLRLVQKDINLALQLGRESNVPMRICNIVAQDIAEAMNRGWATRDAQSFLSIQPERAGLPPFEVPMDQIQAVLDRS
ncbi:NAD(P)-dependent oxidoreductase [Bosea sp. (in: a-proteobacteria)]|uniref:NAD(P)-dependent oxidoreductase n=1 Tax=Bosea sp. (in: a-proteobacteria) TaxID=1871050 RepID=UPI00261CDD14|nr:NAD(P)-dependent oxidoreductase [Bosea sp. (in: a-proteobacteria)]MCO5090035.1 NAD(P)-dependent oxidoreductase [Bosea sp. (in: a-proteobacteria)]